MYYRYSVKKNDLINYLIMFLLAIRVTNILTENENAFVYNFRPLTIQLFTALRQQFDRINFM